MIKFLIWYSYFSLPSFLRDDAEDLFHKLWVSPFFTLELAVAMVIKFRVGFCFTRSRVFQIFPFHYFFLASFSTLSTLLLQNVITSDFIFYDWLKRNETKRRWRPMVRARVRSGSTCGNPWTRRSTVTYISEYFVCNVWQRQKKRERKLERKKVFTVICFLYVNKWMHTMKTNFSAFSLRVSMKLFEVAITVTLVWVRVFSCYKQIQAGKSTNNQSQLPK